MSDTAQWFAEARQHHGEGRLAEAEALYERVLAVEPDHVEALHHLGTLDFKAGRHDIGEVRLRRALALRPNHIAVHVNLGRMLRSLDRIDEAVAAFRAALAIDRFVVPALVGLSDALLASGKAADAVEPGRRAVGLEPERAEAQNALGAALVATGQATEALQCLDRAVALAPSDATAHYNRGVALRALGRRSDAIAAYQRAVAEMPQFAEAHNNLGMLLNEAGEHRAALEHLRVAVRDAPGNAVVHNNLGTGLVHVGALAEALACFERAVELDPAYAEPLANIAGVLRLLGRLGPALESCRRALALQPDLADAYHNQGVILRDLGRFDEARRSIERAVELRPSSAEFRAVLGVLSNDYGAHREAIAHCRAAVELAPDDAGVYHKLLGVLPYDASLGPAQRFAIDRGFGRRFGDALDIGRDFSARSRDPERRLRLGYVTSDLRGDHPVARNLRPILAHRDRERFEVFLYPEVVTPDATSEDFRRLSDAWRPTLGLTDREVAAQIRADHVDLLVILAGRFDRNRPLVAAYRPAPICVSFHDPVTSGIEAVDYLIADPVLAPRHTAERFVERPLRLPSFYIHEALAQAPAVGPLPMGQGAPPTFGCFNNPAKLSDECLALWADVLRAVPRARLLLKFHNRYESAALRARIEAAFTASGLTSDRVEIIAREPDGFEHLEIYNRVDVALDSYPFTGSTTTFEALWMGAPVVTLAGASMISRWSASILRAIGLAELIADTRAAYVGTVAALVQDPVRLAALRATLRDRVAASPLCDGARRSRQLDRLYRAVWRRWCGGYHPSAGLMKD